MTSGRSSTNNSIDGIQPYQGTREASYGGSRAEAIAAARQRQTTSSSLLDISAVSQGTFCSLLLLRIISTIEVAFSKFLPGGFMWQAGAVATVYANYTTDSFVQFGLTGLGDALGVFIGHVSLYAFRRHVLRGRNDVMQAVEVGFVLAAASFVSGSIWQPALNLARDQFLFGFWLCAVVVGVICAIGFFIGLRLARWALPRLCGLHRYRALPPASRTADAMLAMGVFGSSALFVSTANFFKDDPFSSFLSIVDDVSALGMLQAGTSTAVGFSVIIMIQNLIIHPGRHWLDPPDADLTHESWYWWAGSVDLETDEEYRARIRELDPNLPASAMKSARLRRKTSRKGTPGQGMDPTPLLSAAESAL